MSWTEDDSVHFIDEGKYFVPERDSNRSVRQPRLPETVEESLEMCRVLERHGPGNEG